MVAHAPSVFEPRSTSANANTLDSEYDVVFEENGFSYGDGPVHGGGNMPGNASFASVEVVTPASKKNGSGNADKKRKRNHVEDIDIAATRTPANNNAAAGDGDANMTDAPGPTPTLVHSGLTGGLSRLLKSDFPPSPSYSGAEDDNQHQNSRATKESTTRPHQIPTSPSKRTKRNSEKHTTTSKDKHRPRRDSSTDHLGLAGKIIGFLGGGASAVSTVSTGADAERRLVRTRRRSSSEGEHNGSRRPRKTHKVHSSTTRQSRTANTSSRRRSSEEGKKMKSIEYSNGNGHVEEKERRRHRSKTGAHDKAKGNELVIYDSDVDIDDDEHDRDHEENPTTHLALSREYRSSLFLSFVTKGPDSEKGCSVNKALKRWHREIAAAAGDAGAEIDEKEVEEKELWKGLRLKRNERGEVVVFVGGE